MFAKVFVTLRQAEQLTGHGPSTIDGLVRCGDLRLHRRHGATEVCVADLVRLGLLNVDAFEAAPPLRNSRQCRAARWEAARHDRRRRRYHR